MNLDEIKKNYENYDDSNIELIASTEAYGLHEAVIQILKNEIKKRKLSDELLKIVDAQTKEGILKNINQIRNHTCPECNSKTKKLNATIVGKVYSLVIYTNYDKEIKIACSDCLDEFHRKAKKNSAIFGWWGFPWGPIRTISSFMFNNKMKKKYQTNEPSNILIDFVSENALIIESVKDKPDDLTILLKNTNDNIL